MRNRKALNDAAPSIGKLIEAGAHALTVGDIDGAWKHLQAAERLKLMAIDAAELGPIVVSMRCEADKLKSWRKAACLELLKAATDGQDIPALKVVHAAQIRDEHYNNQAYKARIRRRAASFLASAMVAGLIVLILLSRFGALTDMLGQSADLRSGSFSILLAMATMGLIGAAFSSAASSLYRRDDDSRIPEVVLSSEVTLLRLFIGPVSAIFLYFVLESALANSIAKLDQIDGFTLLTFGFIAGFSERLVVRFVKGFIADKSPA